MKPLNSGADPEKTWQEEIKLAALSAERRYGVVFPAGAGAKRLKTTKKNFVKGTKTHFEKKCC